MSRLPAILALSGLIALIALVATPFAALADEVDDYYEDEYGEEETEEEADEAESKKAAVDVPPRLKYARSGFYLYAGGAFVLGHLPDLPLDSEVPALVRIDPGNAGAVNIKIGARFQQYFAAELEYQTSIHWDLPFCPVTGCGAFLGDPNALKTEEATDLHSLTVNAKGYLPLWRFQPFLQLGLGLAMTDAPGNVAEAAFEVRFGGGLEFFVTDYFAVATTVLHTRPYGNKALEGFNYTSFVGSVGYHF